MRNGSNYFSVWWEKKSEKKSEKNLRKLLREKCIVANEMWFTGFWSVSELHAAVWRLELISNGMGRKISVCVRERERVLLRGKYLK